MYYHIVEVKYFNINSLLNVVIGASMNNKYLYLDDGFGLYYSKKDVLKFIDQNQAQQVSLSFDITWSL